MLCRGYIDLVFRKETRTKIGVYEQYEKDRVGSSISYERLVVLRYFAEEKYTKTQRTFYAATRYRQLTKKKTNFSSVNYII